MSDYDTARWRGSVDATIADHERRLEALDNHIAQSAAALQAIQLTLARILVAVPVVIILANALAAVIVYQLTR